MPDLPILVSFPKSGSNWVRYCIEHFSGRPTPGSKRQLLLTSGDFIIDRTHFLDKRDRDAYLRHTVNARRRSHPAPERPRLFGLIDSLRGAIRARTAMRTRRIILLLRDPFALYVRQNAMSPLAMRGYFSNIRLFDKSPADKCLVHYEDLIADFSEMERILKFIGIAYSLDGFDLDAHRTRSLTLYVTGTDRPRTGERLEAFDFHSSRLTPAARTELREFATRQIGHELYARYVGRYDRTTPADELAGERATSEPRDAPPRSDQA